MKRAFAAAAFVLLSAGTGYAQIIEAGQVELAGGTSLAINRQTLTADGEDVGQNVNTATAAADIAYYLSERLGIGVSVGFNKASFPTEGADTLSVSNTAVGPLLRYRIPLGDRATFAVQGAVGIIRTTVEGTGDETLDTSTSGFSVNGGAAVNFYLIDNFAVNFGAVYQRASIDQDEAKFTVAGVTVAVGFSVLFGGN